MKFTNEDVQEIVQLLDATKFDELQLETERFKLTLRRNRESGDWAQEAQVLSPPNVMKSSSTAQGGASNAAPAAAATLDIRKAGWIEVRAHLARYVLSRGETGCAAVCRNWKPCRKRHCRRHPRDDEVDERGPRTGERRNCRDLLRQCAVSRKRRRADAHQTGNRMTLRRILIANRGEIAVRVIRTCQRLGIETVLAASEADLDSMGARLADRTICIGPANSSASYLNVEAVVAAAVANRADAIHPGYGFLSENQKLSAACDRVGVSFIGPTVEQLDAVGDKLKARAHAVAAGLAACLGGEVRSLDEAQRLADELGWPILIKAVGGGGGRGMKRVQDATELAPAMEMAMAEAQASFGDPRVVHRALHFAWSPHRSASPW